MLKIKSAMPCFVHNRCASSKGCPEIVPIQKSEVGFSRHDCSKCVYDIGTCTECFNFNTEECPIPNRCKSCIHCLPCSYCQVFNAIVDPLFFCGLYENKKETP